MKNKTILHVTNVYFSLSYLGNQFKHFSDRDYEQHLICSPSEKLEVYSKSQNIHYSEIEIHRKISPIKDISALIRICKYIHQNKIDIIVGHTPKGAFLAMLAGFLMRVPRRIFYRHGLLYETMNGPLRKLMINMDRLTAFCATKVVCVSPSLAKKSIDDKLNLEKKQIVLGKGTCGGIDSLNKFNPSKIDQGKLNSLRDLLKIDKNDFVIGYCGRLVRDKGIIELIDAYRVLKNNKSRIIKLLLVGDFEVRDALPIEIQTCIINHPDIILTGFIFKDIEYYYSLMNLFVLPSYREGFGMSVIEASAMRIPVLVTKATGCIDSIIEGVTGEYISHSSEEIAATILKLMQAENLSRLGENGRNFVLQYFDNQILWPIIEEKLYRS